jgi:glycosyltransferase involved in cell wall biosynthesis
MNKEIPTIHGLVDIDVFHPVCDKLSLRQKINVQHDRLALLFVGNLKREKGVYELLEAFCQIRDQAPNAILNICGRGVEHGGLAQMISERNLAGSVFLRGPIDPAHMHLWMQASDIFVLPTYNEGMPNVVMEAMACGLPVITSAVGGLPEALHDCEGAILIEPRNSEQLSEAVLKVCGDKTRREQMGKDSRATAVRKFGAKANSQKLIEYLGTIIKQHERRSL